MKKKTTLTEICENLERRTIGLTYLGCGLDILRIDLPPDICLNCEQLNLCEKENIERARKNGDCHSHKRIYITFE